MKYKNIVWDWNGTLLDDRDIGLEVLNVMLSRRNIPTLTLDLYRKVFGFPVFDFYQKVGFDFKHESYEKMSEEFVKVYADCSRGHLKLNEGVVETLRYLNSKGINNYILTALRNDFLQSLLEHFNIAGDFKAVYGSSDIYASGKVECGLRMLKECGMRPEETLMVGDTVHDAEVAGVLNFDSLLFLGGHNDPDRLRRISKVIATIPDIKGSL